MEHTLIQTSKLVIAFRCENSPEKAFEYYFAKMANKEIFPVITYALWKGILLQVTITLASVNSYVCVR